MKQTIILALVAFLCAVGGATWFAAYLAPPRPRVVVAAGPIMPGSAAPSAHSVKPPKRADSAGKKTGAKPAAQAATEKSAPKAGPSDPKADPKIDPKTPADTTAAPNRPSRPPIDSAGLVRSAKSVAKVLASMKPKEAVGILGKLSDEEVERIVRQLNPKQVAALLAAFPQERAAGLSRKLLGPRA